LTSDPGVAAMLTGLAQEIVDQARMNLINSGQVGSLQPRKKHTRRGQRNPLLLIPDPVVVANEIKVKDQSRKYTVTQVKDVDETRVALAISDSPFSLLYEFGGAGVPATAFFRHAIAQVASRHNNARLRQMPGGAATP
jgi:hypothetical protein